MEDRKASSTNPAIQFMRRQFTVLNLARLLLLAGLLYSEYQLDEMRPPWKSAWARHLAEGKDPTFGEHLSTGLWYGAAARMGLCATLLLVSLTWGWKSPADQKPTRFNLARAGDAVVSTRAFALILGVILLAALAMRLPRMTHSFWGDESDAIATYVHGTFRPVDKLKPEGKLYFEQPTWAQTFFSARHGANNHVLFSVSSRISLNIWRKFTHQPQTAFTEWVTRVPSLLAGLGGLVAMAMLIRRWGYPVLGLGTVTFMALHPWHVRYTTEARGYAFMLLLFPILLFAVTNALEKNRWRDWLAFGLCEFLLMYSWAGMLYVMALLNVALAGLILARRDRFPLLSRWLTANLMAGMVFASLYLPHVPQIEVARKRLLWIKGLPMDKVWFHNLITQPFTGIPYHELNATNPSELSWERLYAQSPVLTAAGFAIILAACGVGFLALWRRSRSIALLVSSVVAATIVCVLHFKYILQDELRAWYLIFTLPFVSLCAALGLLEVASLFQRRIPLQPVPWVRTGAAVALLALATASVWPMNASLITLPEEDYKSAVASTIGRHETFTPKGTSKVYTIWLWRYSILYDPRGEFRARDLPAMRVYMDKARATHGELYVIVGFRELAKMKNADMLEVLADPAQFEQVISYPSRESLHTLDVYHMKKQP